MTSFTLILPALKPIRKKAYVSERDISSAALKLLMAVEVTQASIYHTHCVLYIRQLSLQSQSETEQLGSEIIIGGR
jgi:hypothetical protein